MSRIFTGGIMLWREYKFETIVFIVIVAMMFLSFGLGYTMAKDSARAPIIIEKNSE